MSVGTCQVETVDVFVIDPEAQDTFPIAQVPSALPNGGQRKPINYHTATRWATTGLLMRDGTRLKLPTIRAGRVTYTSKQALNWFMQRLAEGFASQPNASVSGS